MSLVAPRIRMKRSTAYDTEEVTPFTAPPSKRIKPGPAEDVLYQEEAAGGSNANNAEGGDLGGDVQMNGQNDVQ